MQCALLINGADVCACVFGQLAKVKVKFRMRILVALDYVEVEHKGDRAQFVHTYAIRRTDGNREHQVPSRPPGKPSSALPRVRQECLIYVRVLILISQKPFALI